MQRVLILLTGIMLVWTALAVAAVPQQINYQGFLTRANGTALDTTVAVQFALCADSLCSILFWTETHPAVTVSHGLFNVRLGELTAFPNNTFDIYPNLWLSIGVGAELLTPPTRVSSVAFSMRVGSVNGASGGTIASDLNVDGRMNVGLFNINPGDYAFVAGVQDSASGDRSTVSGGAQNAATNVNTAVGGGYANKAYGYAAAVGGGSSNDATNEFTFVGGGIGNTAAGVRSGVSAGSSNTASGHYSFVGGGYHNTASGDSSVIGGGSHNSVTSNAGTVGGGFSNTAQIQTSTVAGGWGNTASTYHSAVGGGRGNYCGSYAGVIGGGYGNTTGGTGATIPGGYYNRATGDYSFAAGYRAQTGGDGVFAWADATGDTFSIGLANSFNARASGGFRFWTTSDYGQNIGARLPAGGSAWTTLSDSTKKRNIRLVDTKDVLNRVAQMPIKQWSYKSQDPSIEHIGPMAQDFWRLFHIGDDSLSISTIDPGGIALAAIQELKKKTDEIDVLKARLVKLEAMMAASASVNVTEKGK